MPKRDVVIYFAKTASAYTSRSSASASNRVASLRAGIAYTAHNGCNYAYNAT